MDWQLRITMKNGEHFIIPIHGTYKDALKEWGAWSIKMFSEWREVNSAVIYRVKRIGSHELQEQYFVA